MDRISEALSASRTEQACVTLHISGVSVRGTVIAIDDATVELKDGDRRTVVRLDRIDAVSSE